MKVFVDYIGHADLYYSMHQLFEQRLGAELYRPWPCDEFTRRGIFTPPIADSISVADQGNGLVTIQMSPHNYTQKAITFERFTQMHFDIIITTFSGNELPFQKLHTDLSPSSGFVRQIANIHEKPVSCKNILLSTITTMPPWAHTITYHPEHHHSYAPVGTIPDRTINSFYNNVQTYPHEVAMWNEAKSLLPQFQFGMYGHDNVDGSVPQGDMPEAMQNSMFVWHPKPNGCCGYVARQALACGKPLIVKKNYALAQQTLAYRYLHDGLNCIDLNPQVRSLQEGLKILESWSQPDVYREKCKQIVKRFHQDINFEQEAIAISQWLRKVQP